MKFGIGRFLKKEQNSDKVEITVVDDNEKLPDFRKIAVPDLKQYLINGYNEIREVRKEKEELKNELENEKKYKELYDATLVTLNEFKTRDEENKKIQIKMDKEIIEKEIKIADLKEEVNNYKILETETNKKIENIEKIKQEEKNNGIKEYKQKLIEEINNTKGTISKSKLIGIISSIK